jgi:hypothetical protein
MWTVPELVFESKKLIPALQQLLTAGDANLHTKVLSLYLVIDLNDTTLP